MSASTSATRLVYFGAHHKPRWLVEHCGVLPEVQDGEVLLRVILTTLSADGLQKFAQMASEEVPAVIGCESVCEVVQDRRQPKPVDEINLLHSNVRPRDKHINANNHNSNEKLLSVPLPPGTRCVFCVAVSCQECQNCRNENSRWCHNSTKYGRISLSSGNGFCGTYATHIVMRKSTVIVPVPSCISDRLAAVANVTVAAMVHAIEEARTTSSNTTALVIGSSLPAIFACLLLRHNGYKRVICCDANQSRLKLFAKFGCETTSPINFENTTYSDKSAGGVDCVIDTSGNPGIVETGIRALRCGGKCVCSKASDAVHFPINSEEMIQKGLSIKGVSGYEPRHLREALRFLESNHDRYPFDELFSHRTYNLNEFEAAIHVAELNAFHRVCITP